MMSLSKYIEAITPAGVADPTPAALGLSREQFDAACAVLSRYAIEGRTNPPGMCWSRFGWLLRQWAATETPDAPAPLPEWEGSSIKSDTTDLLARTLSRAGRPITSRDIKDASKWLSVSAVSPTLPGGLLALLMPGDYWRALVGMLEEGPERTALRMSICFMTWGQDLRESTIQGRANAFRRITGDFVALRDHPSGLFAGWDHRGELITPTGDRSPANRGNPDLRTLRHETAELRRELCQALTRALGKRAAPVQLGGELEAIKKLSRARLTASAHSHIFALARNWGLSHTLWVLNGRQHAVRNLNVADFTMARTGAGEMWTLNHRPAKTKPQDEISPKPLRGQAAYPLLVLKELRELLHGGPLPDDWPLFPSSINRQSQRYGKGALGSLLGGVLQKVDQSHFGGEVLRQAIERERAVAKREGRASRERGWFWIKTAQGKERRVWLDAERRARDGSQPIYVGAMRALLPKHGPYEGWNPHSLRKTGSQVLDTPRVSVYLSERNWEFKQDYLSEVLQDHENETVAEIYKLPPDVRERITCMAIEILNELLYGRLGARLVPDARRYEQALDEVMAFEAHRCTLKGQRAELRDRRRDGEITADEYDVALDEVAEEVSEVAAQLARLEVEIERIEQRDPLTLVPLPDSAPEEETEVDLQAIRALKTGESQPEPAGRLRPKVRGWITATAELAGVAGCSPKQAGLWTHDDSRRRVIPKGTPIFLTSIPPVISLAPSRRVIPVAAINPEWLDEVPIRRRRLEVILRDWVTADKWNTFRNEHYQAPDWLAGELEQLGALEAALAASDAHPRRSASMPATNEHEAKCDRRQLR